MNPPSFCLPIKDGLISPLVGVVHYPSFQWLKLVVPRIHMITDDPPKYVGKLIDAAFLVGKLELGEPGCPVIVEEYRKDGDHRETTAYCEDGSVWHVLTCDIPANFYTCSDGTRYQSHYKAEEAVGPNTVRVILAQQLDSVSVEPVRTFSPPE